MIELTMEEFILWVIGVPLLGMGLWGLISGLRCRARRRMSRMQIVTCRVCGYVYHDASREKVPECPVCGRRNERGASRRLG